MISRIVLLNKLECILKSMRNLIYQSDERRQDQ